jgi:DNA-binding PadR family transcriptional regulator
VSIRHAILGVLRQGPMHGYHVASELERLIAGGRYNSAQIYQGLHALAERGFVVAATPEPGPYRDRRPFSITASGRREFDRWLSVPLVPWRPLRDDAVIKLVFLCRHDPSQLIRFLERLRRQHLRRLAGTQSRPRAGLGSDVIDDALVADLSGAALRFREEAELRWIDHCLLRLRPLIDETASQVGVAVDEQIRGEKRRREPS